MSESPLPQNRPLQESDLSALVGAGARENRFLEFKREYIPDAPNGKKKFLQSVAAFANSRGGDLILGMEESDGKAVAPVPLKVDPDACRLQILNLIRVHIRPPLGGVNVEAVALAAGGHVLVVRVPKTWAGPHMLYYDDDRRFYIRDDGGKRPMDYEDVRDGFLGGENTVARLRNFRMERCAAILNDETPRPLSHSSRIVLHLLPFDMFIAPRRFETRQLVEKCQPIQAITHSSWGHTFDMDGCFSESTTPQGLTKSYAYVFRSGAVEAVDASLLAPWPDDEGAKNIPHVALEGQIIAALTSYFVGLAALDVPFPYVLFLSLLNVRGYPIAPNPRYINGHPICRDHLYIPEAVFESRSPDMAHTVFTIC